MTREPIAVSRGGMSSSVQLTERLIDYFKEAQK